MGLPSSSKTHFDGSKANNLSTNAPGECEAVTNAESFDGDDSISMNGERI